MSKAKAKAKTKTPEISIVIPVYNEEGIISASLSDLVRQLGNDAFDYEIIVAENGSSDRTVEIAESFANRVTRAPSRRKPKPTRAASCTKPSSCMPP